MMRLLNKSGYYQSAVNNCASTVLHMFYSLDKLKPKTKTKNQFFFVGANIDFIDYILEENIWKLLTSLNEP